ncbi:hypothetical protein JHK87_025114 [Glycine soja]|nr:hypothetical protein JHK87_025114 [Glycine soja]
MDEKTIPDDTEQIFFMSTDIVDCLKEDLAWASYVLLRNTNVIAMEGSSHLITYVNARVSGVQRK